MPAVAQIDIQQRLRSQGSCLSMNLSKPAIHDALLASFEVFRRPQNAEDLEDGVAPSEPVRERFGLLPEQVRRVVVSRSQRVWATPGARGAALSCRSPVRGRDGGFSTGSWSGPVEPVARRGLLGWTVSLEGIETYYGLVPDGNDTVEMHLADGSQLAISVVQNVFIAQPDSIPLTVELLDSAGDRYTRETGR
jgi:hypothetical protein